ncbi:hypothetical protein [uncultured Ruminococcus sp.]|uniref:hypothetical protein n=1 Tax=uncultured Ruminococcus sp. TaxID=165186 RepID=UPI0025F87114|nr:hypothetical protein [uncultured Ruminococcus sp.]
MTYKRIISGLLALSLTASMMPTAIADTNDDSNTNNENTNTVTINKDNPSGQMILTLTVKGTLDLSLEMADWAYQSEASEPVLTGNTGNGDVTYYYKPQGAEDDAYTTKKPTAEGAYTVMAKVAETDGYYGGTATADFKITPLTAGMEINLKVKKTITRDDYEFILPNSFVYDGQPKVFGVVNNNTDMPKATVEYYNAEGVKLDSAPVNAGKFTIKVVYGENEEYKAVTFDNIGTFNIVRANAEVTPPKAVTGLVFDGKEHDLVEAGSTKSGKIVYRIANDDDEQLSNFETGWQDTIPTATNAGEYQVQWRVLDDDKNNWDVEPEGGRVFVTIAEAYAEVTPPKRVEDLVYDGKEHDLVEAGSANKGKMLYKVTKLDDSNIDQQSTDESWQTVIPTAKDAGIYRIDYMVDFGENKDNYVPVLGYVDVEIAKATAQVTAPRPVDDLVFDGNKQALVEAGSTTGGKIEYRVNEGQWQEEVPTARNADTYFVEYRVNFGEDANNWNDGDVGAFDVEIAKATAQVTAPKPVNGLVFNGNEQALVEAGSTTGGKIEYRVHPIFKVDGVNEYQVHSGGNISESQIVEEEGDWSTEIPTAINAGWYCVEYRVNFGEDANNWNDVDPDMIYVEIDKATAQVTAPKPVEGLKYNRKEQTLVEAGSTSVGTMEYKVDEGEWSADLPKAADAGEHVVYYRVNFGDDAANWNEFVEDTIVVNIDNTFTVTWKNGDETIETDELVEFGTMPSYDGEEPVWTGEDNEVFVFAGWDKEVEEVTDDVTYTAKFKKYTKVGDAFDETCEEDGQIEYYIGDDELYYTIKDDVFFNIDEGEWVIPAKGHNYNVRPIWTWNADKTVATATFICANDETHKEILDAYVSSTSVPGTIGNTGNQIITATVVFNNRTYTNVLNNILPAVELEYVPAKDPTCAVEGNIAYYKGTDGKFYVTDGDGYKEISEKDTVIETTDSHTFGEPEFVWADDYTAKAKFTCADCDAEETFDAEVELVKTAPTYTENGLYVYTASYEVDGNVYTDTKEVVINSPEPIDVTYTPGEKSARLSWNKIDGAEKYAICMMVDGKWTKYAEGYNNFYILNDLVPGTKYQVTVIPMVQNIWCSDFTHAITVEAKAEQSENLPTTYPEVKTQVNGKRFKLTWTTVENAEKYGIAVYQAGKWVVKTTVDSNTTTFVSPTVTSGTYKMVVCAKVNGKWDTRSLNSRAFEVTIK